MAIANKLSQLSKMWKAVKPITPSYSTVPDGEYVAKINEMKITESKKSGRLQIETVFEIVDGEYETHTVRRFDGIDNETGMGYFKGFCEIIGFEVPNELQVLQEGMDDFVSKNEDLFNIVVKTKDGYSNVYVNGVSDMVLANEGSEDEENEGEEPEVVNEDEVEGLEEEESEEEAEEVEIPRKKGVTATKQVSKPIPKKITTIRKK